MFQHIPREYQKEFYVIEHDDFGLADFVQAKDINEFLHVPMMSKITDFLPPVPHRDHWINFWIKKEWLTVICTHSNINSEKYWFLFFFYNFMFTKYFEIVDFRFKIDLKTLLGSYIRWSLSSRILKTGNKNLQTFRVQVLKYVNRLK